MHLFVYGLRTMMPSLHASINLNVGMQHSVTVISDHREWFLATDGAVTERPLTETLCCTSMRCALSRCVRVTGLRKPSQLRTREEFLYVHLCTYTQPMQLCEAL